MFPSHQSDHDHFSYEISYIPHYEDFEQQNLTISGEASAGGINNNFTERMGKGNRLKQLAASTAAVASNCDNDGQNNDATKIPRKEIERQRRQQMTKLCHELRSRLPSESIKGKRAVSDQMNEAVNYIKYLKRRIQDLSVKRDKLKKISNFSAVDQRNIAFTSSDYSSLINCVAIHPYGEGLQIVINSGSGDETWHLSTMMQVILEQGLDVVCCVSSQTSEGFLHTIHCEVSDPTHQIDLPELQSRLNDLILYDIIY